jgi:hypothetical protein
LFTLAPEAIKVTGIHLYKEEYDPKLEDRLSDEFLAAEKHFTTLVRRNYNL